MKISIITVVYNREKTIKDCINSVLCQTHKNVEYIVIDGLSNDGTIEILKSYGDNIDRFISEKDNGLYHAMNKGIEIATGEIIGFLHSDDLYYNDSVLSSIASKFENNPSLDACYGDMVYVSEINTSRIIRYWKSSPFVQGSFSKGWSPPHPTFFVSRNIYKKLGGFSLNYNIASDVELMMRYLEVNKINAEYCHQLWIKMRLGGISNKKSINVVKQNLEVLDALKYHNLPKNILTFVSCKLLSRIKQYVQRPTNSPN